MKHNKKKLLSIFLFIIPFLVWGQSKVEIFEKDLKLILYPKSGSFSLARLSEKGKNKYESLIDDRNASASSFFSVLFNDQSFKLQKKLWKPVVFENDDSRAQYIFTLNDDFQVKQTFSFVNNAAFKNSCALKIETKIENTSGKDARIALKFLADTILGESTRAHFFSDGRDAILSETKISVALDNDSYIISQDSFKSLIFYLKRTEVTKPEHVYIANWDRLNSKTWHPDHIAGRSFSTVYSINDSALLFLWPEKLVPNKHFTSITLLLGIQHDGLESTRKDDSIGEENSTLLIDVPEQTDQEHVLLEEESKYLLEGNKIEDYETKLLLLNQIQARIELIEENPDLATSNEFNDLNRALDELLLQF